MTLGEQAPHDRMERRSPVIAALTWRIMRGPRTYTRAVPFRPTGWIAPTCAGSAGDRRSGRDAREDVARGEVLFRHGCLWGLRRASLTMARCIIPLARQRAWACSTISRMLLAGDIGATKTLLGLFARAPSRPAPLSVQSFATSDTAVSSTWSARFSRGSRVDGRSSKQPRSAWLAPSSTIGRAHERRLGGRRTGSRTRIRACRRASAERSRRGRTFDLGAAAG